MNVSCPDCGSVFRVDPAKVAPDGVRAKCSICGGVIAISGRDARRSTPMAAMPTPVEIPLAVDSRAMTPLSQTPVSETPIFVPPVPETPISAAPIVAPEPAVVPLDDDEIGLVEEPEEEPPLESFEELTLTTLATEPPRPLTPVAPAPIVAPPAPAVPTPYVATPAVESPVVDTPTVEAPILPVVVPPPAPVARPALTPPVRSPTPRTTMPTAVPPATPASGPAFGGFRAGPAGIPGARPAAAPPAAAPVPPKAPTPASVSATPTPATPLFSTPVAAGETLPPRRPMNPFLANDPSAKAKRLARALVSDMIAYLPQKREEGLRDGTLKQIFREEIKKSYEEYVDQIGREIAENTTHFQEALNDLLAGGQKIF